MVQAEELQHRPICVNPSVSEHSWVKTLDTEIPAELRLRPPPVLLQSGSSWRGPLCICSSGFLFQCFYATHYNKVFPC